MKAVIVECSNGAAVALCDDGTFRKLRNKGYSIGQELIIRQKSSSSRMVQKLSICASLALVLLSFAGIGSHSYVEPYSYVSLDINPSIEYALNRYDKVISVSGINTEGQQVVSSIESDIKNQNITTALGVTIGQLEKDHYISQEEYNHVIVSVYSTNDTKAQSITSRVNTFSAEKSDICSIDTIPVSKEVKDDADSLGITPGKLALIHAVAESTSDSNFDVSKWTDKTVSELETTIQQAGNQDPDSGTAPASANVVNGEYLSSVLDDNAANKPDNSTAAAMDAAQEAGSASADKPTATTDHTTTDSGANGSVSAEKPDQAGNTVTPATDGSADSADSAAKPDTSAPSHSDSSTGNQNNSATAPDKNHSAGKDESSGTSSSKKPSADDTASPDKGDVSTGTGSNTDDSLTEDSAGKKDPYPDPDTNVPDETGSGEAGSDGSGSNETGSDDILQEDTSSKNFPYTESSGGDSANENFTNGTVSDGNSNSNFNSNINTDSSTDSNKNPANGDSSHM